MKKRILCMILALITVCSLCFTAQAAPTEAIQPRWNSTAVVYPGLWFSGSNAMCKLQVVASEEDASIRATIKLKDSSGTAIYTWNATGTGFLDWIGSRAVSSGTYTMTVYVQVYHPDTGSDYITDSYTATL